MAAPSMSWKVCYNLAVLVVSLASSPDSRCVFCVGHPYEPMIATSGIDDTIKVFSPDQRAQDDARRGINILDPDNPANTIGRHVAGVSGLRSRKCMDDCYRITSQNDAERQGGMNEARIAVRLSSV